MYEEAHRFSLSRFAKVPQARVPGRDSNPGLTVTGGRQALKPMSYRTPHPNVKYVILCSGRRVERAVPPIRISCWRPRHFYSELEMCELSQPIWKIKVSVLLGSSYYCADFTRITILKILSPPFSFYFPSPSWSILDFSLFLIPGNREFCRV